MTLLAQILEERYLEGHRSDRRHTFNDSLPPCTPPRAKRKFFQLLSMASLSGTEYALSRQKLNKIVKALHDCGTEEVVKLPKIAVIGNQSAGKSSLIEVISQIRVPRASGTCTRCPMEVVLSCGNPEERHCKVSLRFEHEDVSAQLLGVFKFGETDSKDEVTDLLHCAQLAILNPGKIFASFLNLTEEECKNHRREINFSQNTVILEITGAPVDVTFIDLPGIISSTEKVYYHKEDGLTFTSPRRHISLM